jgi:hypothetical protein
VRSARSFAYFIEPTKNPELVTDTRVLVAFHGAEGTNGVLEVPASGTPALAVSSLVDEHATTSTDASSALETRRAEVTAREPAS